MFIIFYDTFIFHQPVTSFLSTFTEKPSYILVFTYDTPWRNHFGHVVLSGHHVQLWDIPLQGFLTVHRVVLLLYSCLCSCTWSLNRMVLWWSNTRKTWRWAPRGRQQTTPRPSFMEALWRQVCWPPWAIMEPLTEWSGGRIDELWEVVLCWIKPVRTHGGLFFLCVSSQATNNLPRCRWYLVVLTVLSLHRV